MNNLTTESNPSRPSNETKRRQGLVWWIGGSFVALLAGGALFYAFEANGREGTEGLASKGGNHAAPLAQEQEEHPAGVVTMTTEQQQAVGVKTLKIDSKAEYDVLAAPGLVTPNESQYAFITPRVEGVVRTVNARIGQVVQAGDLLATIDSPLVGEARLDLSTKLQALELANAQADWEEKVYQNTRELIDLLRKGVSPEAIHTKLEDKPVGENRERLMTAYAQYRLLIATIERNKELNDQKLITPKQFQEVTADYEVALATYQSLMDEMGFEAKLAYTRSQQTKKQAESAVRTAQERLRIYGVKSDGTVSNLKEGKVVGVLPDGNIKSKSKVQAGEKPADPLAANDEPVSTYSMWAPFDGVILDREMIVPGVAVDRTHRIFTMANLTTVWVEASVHEGDFSRLSRSEVGTKIRFRSPAYPEIHFDGQVIYSGDLVDEKSRTIKLLAKAENPKHLLKPGMFVDVEVLSPRADAAVQIPATAILIEDENSYVYVKQGEDRFVRRAVEAEPPSDGQVNVVKGLDLGDEVVVSGEYKLKALSIKLALSNE